MDDGGIVFEEDEEDFGFETDKAIDESKSQSNMFEPTRLSEAFSVLGKSAGLLNIHNLKSSFSKRYTNSDDGPVGDTVLRSRGRAIAEAEPEEDKELANPEYDQDVCRIEEVVGPGKSNHHCRNSSRRGKPPRNSPA